MSLRVLVIPEDPTNNGYILRPLVGRMLEAAGKPNARIHVLTNPKLDGYDHAVSAIRAELADRYRHYDLWLFVPDADRAGDLVRIENELRGRGIRLLCCAAVPELEIWCLAGHRELVGVPWAHVRQHPRLKEDIFDPFLAVYGDPRSAGGGREQLIRDALTNYQGLLQVCPELEDLDVRIKAAVAELGRHA